MMRNSGKMCGAWRCLAKLKILCGKLAKTPYPLRIICCIGRFLMMDNVRFARQEMRTVYMLCSSVQRCKLCGPQTHNGIDLWRCVGVP